MAGPAPAIATPLPTKRPALMSATCRLAKVCGSERGSEGGVRHGRSDAEVADEFIQQPGNRYANRPPSVDSATVSVLLAMTSPIRNSAIRAHLTWIPDVLS